MSCRFIGDARRLSDRARRSAIRFASACESALADGSREQRFTRCNGDHVLDEHVALLRSIEKRFATLAHTRHLPSLTAHRAALRDGWVQIWVHDFENRLFCRHFSVFWCPGGLP
jgi:hypothetical protein